MALSYTAIATTQNGNIKYVTPHHWLASTWLSQLANWPVATATVHTLACGTQGVCIYPIMIMLLIVTTIMIALKCY